MASAAYGSLLRSEDDQRKKGGYRLRKLSPDDVEFVFLLVEEKSRKLTKERVEIREITRI